MTPKLRDKVGSVVQLIWIQRKKHKIVLYDCLIKTQHAAKDDINLSIGCDFCPMPAG